MHPILNIAIHAVRKAGNLLVKYYDIPDSVRILEKENDGFSTNIDKEIEYLIAKVIRKYYPYHTVHSKNNDVIRQEKMDVQWIINPLDGVDNFIKHFPHFSISVAVLVKGKVTISVIYDPIRNELFTASRGKGAQLNGFRIRGSTVRNLFGSVLAINFSFKEKLSDVYQIFINELLFKKHSNFRCVGSVMLDLAYVSAGRIDGIFRTGLKSWELLCGELIIRESGCLITNFVGDCNYSFSGDIVAGNSHIVREVTSFFRSTIGNLCY